MTAKTNRTTNREFVGTVTQCLEDFSRDYNQALDDDYKERLKALSPGHKAPPRDNIIHDKAISERMTERANELRAKALEVTDRVLAEITAEKMTPPSQEAVNVLATLQIMGDSLREDQLADVRTSYGENYFVSQALNKLSMNAGLKAETVHHLDAVGSEVSKIRNTIVSVIDMSHSRFNGNSSANPARVKFINDNIKATFPDGIDE